MDVSYIHMYIHMYCTYILYVHSPRLDRFAGTGTVLWACGVLDPAKSSLFHHAHGRQIRQPYGQRIEYGGIHDSMTAASLRPNPSPSPYAID